MYRIQIFEIRPEPNVAGYPPAYSAETGTKTGHYNACCAC